MAANLNLSNGSNNSVGSNNSPNSNETNSNTQPTFINIPAEDVPLFAVRSKYRDKRRREEGDLESGEEETLKQLLEKEVEKNKEENKIVPGKDHGPSSKSVSVKIKRAPVVRRKAPEDELPQISSLVPLYSIITDLRDKLANITIGQLLRAVPSMRTELIKSL